MSTHEMTPAAKEALERAHSALDDCVVTALCGIDDRKRAHAALDAAVAAGCGHEAMTEDAEACGKRLEEWWGNAWFNEKDRRHAWEKMARHVLACQAAAVATAEARMREPGPCGLHPLACWTPPHLTSDRKEGGCSFCRSEATAALRIRDLREDVAATIRRGGKK